MTRRASFVSLVCLVPLVALAGCVDLSDTTAVSGDAEQGVSTTTYGELSDYSKLGVDQWFADVRSLNTEFGNACGDTFCGGDWSNLTPMSFACSVTEKLGSIQSCAWTFSASQIVVDPTTSTLQTNLATFVCPIKVKSTAVKFSALLASTTDPLHVAIPGYATINEQLAGCFDHPIGATPIVAGPQTPVTYVAASDYYTSAPSRAKWAAAQKGLLDGFNNICGDTFCGSDFGDLQSLQFECSVTKSSGNIKSCAWVFGGSFSEVDPARGTLSETSKNFRCTVPVKGTLPQLVAVLTAAGPQPASDRILPGETTSAYDALGGCLP